MSSRRQDKQLASPPGAHRGGTGRQGLRRAQRGEFLAVFAAPPCSTFSICRFIKSPTSADGGPPVVRRRSDGQVVGSKDCPPAHRREVKLANELVARTCAILHAAAEAGSEFAVENPADRGNVENLSTFVDADHAPLWLMPDIQRLSKFASCRYSTFPMCAFGVDYEKPCIRWGGSPARRILAG